MQRLGRSAAKRLKFASIQYAIGPECSQNQSGVVLLFGPAFLVAVIIVGGEKGPHVAQQYGTGVKGHDTAVAKLVLQ